MKGMERIGCARVGINRACSQNICSTSIANRSSASNKFPGEGSGARAPVLLSTIVIDRLPKVYLSVFAPKRPSSRKLATVVTSAASLTAVSTIPEVSVDDGTRRPQTRRRRGRAIGTTRRKRKSPAGTVIVADLPTASNIDPELQRLAEALESVYNKDATTDDLNYEIALKDLEAQAKIAAEMGDTAELAVSSGSSPPALSARKKRGRPPLVSTSADSLRSDQQAPLAVVSSQPEKDGRLVRSVPSVVVKRRIGEGKRRLNLISRIALRKRRQDKSLRGANEACSTTGIAAQDIWSEEAESLINKHGVALELGVVDWDNLKRGLLSFEEESELVGIIKPIKKYEKMRKTLRQEIGRDPSEEEWAAAAQMDVHTLRRHRRLGKAARNKLIQHNLRLVLFQANKYYRESSSLSLFDLCQEGVTGLLHAIDKFDPKRGHRFSTYAVYWVRNSILRAQTRSGNILRSPYNVAMHKLNIKRTKLDLLVELERAPTEEEVMERLGLTPERYRDVVRSSMRTGSLNRKSEVTGEDFVQTVADKSTEVDRAIVRRTGDDASLRFGVGDVLDSLKPREGLVLRQRFGLDGQGERTLGEIGQTLGLSREMVRKYETCALMKMKHHTRMDYLRTYLS